MKLNENILVYFQKSAICIEEIYENKLYVFNTCNHYCNLEKNNLLLFLSWLIFAMPYFLLYLKFSYYFTNSVFIELNP